MISEMVCKWMISGDISGGTITRESNPKKIK